MIYEESYRHIIDSDIKAAFRNAFSEALEIVDKKKFGLVGLFGSFANSHSHDIDVVIAPSRNARIGDSYLECSKLFDETSRILKEIDKKYYIVASRKMVMQEFMYHIAVGQEGEKGMIPVHFIFFTSYHEMQKIFPKSFTEDMQKNLIVLHGNINSINVIPSLSQEKLVPYYYIMEIEISTLLRVFPNHLVRRSIEHLFNHLGRRYNIPIPNEIPHDIDGIRKEFESLVLTIDEMTYV
jgi:hypothetical protein